MLSMEREQGSREEAPDLWRALANPVRRQLLDALSDGPRTTGQLAEAAPDLSRFAVMQHLGVLTDAGLVLVRRRGRHRFNHLNAVPLRRWYERWVTPFADRTAAELLALQRSVEAPEGNGPGGEAVDEPQDESQDAPTGGKPMAVMTDELRTVRIETELRFRATPQRVFDVLTDERPSWFPATYGEERVQRIVMEPRVGGAHYEDWGEGRGHLYGQVTKWDPPTGFATRGRLGLGVILDSEYEMEVDGAETILRVSKVAVGPLTESEAAGISKYGDVANFEDALRAAIEG
jgi:DNA-binding transcriptional ArsR family regulator